VRLVPLLVANGHVVAGMTRSPGKVESLRVLGAEAVVCDVYEPAALREAVTAFRPELVMHQLTDLPDDEASLATATDANARIRREGTRNLLAAAEGAGARRVLAQSVAWELSGAGAAAKEERERAVLGFGGVILRYGRFYGSGTYHAESPAPPRIQIDEAARRTTALLDAPSGIVEVVEANG
jgi:nucleoside-diphosphate-sugar epimerase